MRREAGDAGEQQGDAMKKGWHTKPFEDCIEKVSYISKVQRKDFLDDGAYPIISQEDDFINGCWNNEADLFTVRTPIVVFGDHTKVLKYVDFDFVLGADGVKILWLKYHNSIVDTVADLGKPEEIGKVFTGFQKYLYQQQASA